jgi:uncharacterized protein
LKKEQTMKSISVTVLGMHCPSCSALMTEEFGSVPGVHHAEVNLKGASAEIFFEGAEPAFEEIAARATRYGYTVKKKTDPVRTALVNQGSRAAQARAWILGALAAALMAGFFLILQQTGIMEGLSATAGSGRLGLGLFMGVVASLSTCFAVTGSLVIAFGGLYGEGKADHPVRRAVRANALFHAGRLGTFFALGGVLGAVGGGLAVSGRALAVVMIVYALAMALMGLSILGFFKRFARRTTGRPSLVSRITSRLKASSSPLAPVALGAITFFLPCGFTQSMQVLALGAGGFLNGGILMLVFALGTTPVLFAAGVTSSWTRFKGVAFLRKAAGILVVVFAVFTFVSGTSLIDFDGNVFAVPVSAAPANTAPVNTAEKTIASGPAAPDATPFVEVTPSPAAPAPTTGPEKTPAPAKTPEKPAVQRVDMHVTYGGFEPAVLKVKAGVPVQWVIHGDEVTGCTSRIIVPSLNINQTVRDGENVVTFTPDQPGRINFSCWMGMVRGAFIVE